MYKEIVAAVAILSLTGTGAAGTADVPLPDWMAGAWIQSDGDAWAEEYWTPARGGLMIGAARTGKGKTLESWEASRIQTDDSGKISFVASPNGGAPIRFSLVSTDQTAIVFSNPAHDYPQRIRYWRVGKLLRAEISLADGSKPMGWEYRPMGELSGAAAPSQKSDDGAPAGG